MALVFVKEENKMGIVSEIKQSISDWWQDLQARATYKRQLRAEEDKIYQTAYHEGRLEGMHIKGKTDGRKSVMPNRQLPSQQAPIYSEISKAPAPAMSYTPPKPMYDFSYLTENTKHINTEEKRK